MSDRIPTFADVCSAIAEGHLVFAIEDGIYQVNVLELRRYFNRLRSLPSISPTGKLIMSGSRPCSSPTNISFA